MLVLGAAIHLICMWGPTRINDADDKYSQRSSSKLSHEPGADEEEVVLTHNSRDEDRFYNFLEVQPQQKDIYCNTPFGNIRTLHLYVTFPVLLAVNCDKPEIGLEQGCIPC